VRRPLLTLFVLLALVLGACSGGDDEAAPTTTSTSRPATTTTAAPTTTSTIATRPAAPPVPADAGAAVTSIRDADAVVHDHAATDANLAVAGHALQIDYREMALHPDWDDDVRAALPASLRDEVAANVEAARQLRALVRNPKPNMPAWTIVAPAPRDELLGYYKEAERTFGVPWEYLAAVHLTETKMGRIRGTSTAGAKGPMQFLPSTWEAYGGGGDIESNHDSILAAARYLAANGAPERMADALHHYNPTDKYVKAVTAYAEVMRADPDAYRGYYHWQVYYWSTLGDVWLRVGYSESTERPVTPADL
jgi:membrane-bound lytic murein transglycosylase B